MNESFGCFIENKNNFKRNKFNEILYLNIEIIFTTLKLNNFIR